MIYRMACDHPLDRRKEALCNGREGEKPRCFVPGKHLAKLCERCEVQWLVAVEDKATP